MTIISIFDNLNDEIIRKSDVDAIKELIRPLMKGLRVDSPVIPLGQFFYRARKFDFAFNKKNGIKIEDLKYPPTNKAKLGRSNRDKQSMFYCSLSKEPIFFELLNLTDNDEIVVSFWQSNEKMLVNNIGYTQYLFEKLGAKRVCPTWSAKTSSLSDKFEITLNDNSILEEVKEFIYSHDKNRAIREAMSNAFMCHVDEENNHRYKLTVALTELHLGKINNYPIQFAGILYPSLRAGAEGDNLALLPEFVDNNLKFKKAIHIKVENKQDKKIKITYLDYANSLSADGSLQWLGRLPHWSGNSSQEIICVCTAGTDDEGDYFMSTDGIKCHWVVRDKLTGKMITPS